MLSPSKLMKWSFLGNIFRSLTGTAKGFSNTVQPTRSLQQRTQCCSNISIFLTQFSARCLPSVHSSCSVNLTISCFRGIATIPFYQSEKLESFSILHRMHLRKPRKKRKKRRPLNGLPVMKGVVLKTLIKKPKKPNSGNRKCVLVRLSSGKEAIAHVPGIGHNLQEHHVVLIRCGRTKDVPGLKLKVVRGKYDCAPVIKDVKK